MMPAMAGEERIQSPVANVRWSVPLPGLAHRPLQRPLAQPALIALIAVPLVVQSYGIFAIAATAAGMLDVEQITRIEVYLLTYVVMALVVAAIVLVERAQECDGSRHHRSGVKGSRLEHNGFRPRGTGQIMFQNGAALPDDRFFDGAFCRQLSDAIAGRIGVRQEA